MTSHPLSRPVTFAPILMIGTRTMERMSGRWPLPKMLTVTRMTSSSASLPSQHQPLAYSLLPANSVTPQPHHHSNPGPPLLPATPPPTLTRATATTPARGATPTDNLSTLSISLCSIALGHLSRPLLYQPQHKQVTHTTLNYTLTNTCIHTPTNTTTISNSNNPYTHTHINNSRLRKSCHTTRPPITLPSPPGTQLNSLNSIMTSNSN